MLFMYIITILVFTTVFTFIFSINSILFGETFVVSKRLSTIANKSIVKDKVDDNLKLPFFDRALKPFLSNLARKYVKVIPHNKKLEISNKLQIAGNPGNLSPSEFMALEYVLTVGVPLVILFVSIMMNLNIKQILISVIFSLVIGTLLPNLVLKAKTKKRQEEIVRQLPDVLDLLTVSIEAGLGFDAALAKVVEKTKGVLSDEFARVLQEIRMGKPRRDALRDCGQRTGVPELQSFIGALVQADQLGVRMGNVIRMQSEQIRQNKKTRVEEKAMKAPVKMLFPLVIFIFPTIFIVVLGPAIIKIINALA